MARTGKNRGKKLFLGTGASGLDFMLKFAQRSRKVSCCRASRRNRSAVLPIYRHFSITSCRRWSATKKEPPLKLHYDEA